MDDVTIKKIMASMEGQSLRHKLYIWRLYGFEVLHQRKPYIAIILCAIAIILIHINKIYVFEPTDLYAVLGIGVTIGGLAIAENQLLSWKQEKLLDRLEVLFLSADTMLKLCTSIEGSGIYGPDGQRKYSVFTDDDILKGADLIRLGILDKHSITEQALKMQHQILFITKLLEKHSFKLNGIKDVKSFLDNTYIYMSNVVTLVDTYDLIYQSQEGTIGYSAQPGMHARLLNEHYDIWRTFNRDRYGVINQKLFAGPSIFIRQRTLALIQTLRV